MAILLFVLESSQRAGSSTATSGSWSKPLASELTTVRPVTRLPRILWMLANEEASHPVRSSFRPAVRHLWAAPYPADSHRPRRGSWTAHPTGWAPATPSPSWPTARTPTATPGETELRCAMAVLVQQEPHGDRPGERHHGTGEGA
jgi:hypothetical protein